MAAYGGSGRIGMNDELENARKQIVAGFEAWKYEMSRMMAELSRAFAFFIEDREVQNTLFEDAYRAYAAKLNWKRPRGRKVSWRRLNHEQRKEAVRLYYGKGRSG